MPNQHNILLSGSTGILGSHILFELLYQYASGELSGKLGLVIRPFSGLNFRKGTRLEHILNVEFVPEFLKGFTYQELTRSVFVVMKEIHELRLTDFPADFTDVLFIHAAGSVNLANSDQVFHEIEFNNFDGTLSVLKQTFPILRKFVFISTAYATGHREGMIDNEFLNYSDCRFRNPYESFKNKTEKRIVEFCEKNNVEWQILRPSIICGRLLDSSLYFIPRFSVFYLICKFFYLLKKCTIADPHIRIYAAPNSGLNILPVDYLAKAIVRLMYTPDQEVNLVNSNHVSISELFRIGLKEFNYQNYSMITTPIQDPTLFEKRYDKTINSQLLPYLDTPIHKFNTARIRQVMSDYPEPDVFAHFAELIRFAARHNFKSIY
jgi:nucleoside-diphosphate-sugar epimerase